MSREHALEEEMPREVEQFMRAMRQTLPEQPDPRLEGALVAQLAQTAAASQNGHGEAATVSRSVIGRLRWQLRRTWRSPRLLPARIAIAAGLLVLSMGGLAVAGVKLPGPVNSVLDEVGVTLPNQPDDDAGAGGDAPAAPKSGSDGPAGAGGKAKAKGHSKSKSADKPGRRVRRRGNDGPVPGPANPPEGNAYGQSKPKPEKAPPTPPTPPAPKAKPIPTPKGATPKGAPPSAGKLPSGRGKSALLG